MALLQLADGTVLNGMPPMPGEGIVPPAPPPVAFAQPSAFAPQPVAAQPAAASAGAPPVDSFAPRKGSTVGGILSTLLGWRHQEDVAKRHERVGFLQQEIHDALTNPNNRLPREDLDRYVSELAQNVQSSQAPNIGKILKNHVEQVFHSRDIAQKQQQQQQQTPPPQAPPVIPPPTIPPATPPAAAAGPPGITSPGAGAPQTGGGFNPFDGGAPAGGPPPLQNENPATKISSVAGTVGFGGPPPTTLAQADPYQGRHIRSLADMATEKTQAEVASMRVLASYGHERVANALSILEQMGIDRSKLTPTQIASYMQAGTIPEVVTKPIPEGGMEMIMGPNGPQFVMGQRKAVTTAPGATTTFLDNPNLQPGTLYGPGAQPMPAMPTSATPGGAAMTVKGEPKLSDAQRAYNAYWESTHGQPITPDKYAEAKSQFDEAAITKSARQIQGIRVANLQELRASRQLRERQLNQTIREFEATKGPAAIDSLADQVYQNPDYFAKLTGDVSNLVGQRFTQKYNLPPPRPLPTARKDQEDASIISLNHAQAIREYLKNPVVQKRMGKWDGRLGTLEQAVGDTAGLKPEDSRVIQDLRSRLNYFFAQESKSAFGGRTAKEFLDEIKASSPRMSMGMPLIEGALDAAEGMAKVNLVSGQQYRYNQQPGTAMNNPPPGTKTHNIPDIGETFNGGKVLRVTPVK